MRLLLITIAFCTFPLSASAEPEAGFAVKGGLNASTLTADYRTYRGGFSGGAAGYLQSQLSSKFGIGGQLELLYTPRGAEVVFDDLLQGKSRSRYLDVVLAARPVLRLGPVSGYLLLGGGLDLLLSASKESVTGAKEDVTDDLPRFDVALVIGAGIAVHLPGKELGPLRLGTVFLEGRYDHGLVEMGITVGGGENRNSSVMLGVALAWGAGSDDVKPECTPGDQKASGTTGYPACR